MRHHRTLIRRLRARVDAEGFGPAVVRLRRLPGAGARPFRAELRMGNRRVLSTGRASTKADALWLLAWAFTAHAAARPAPAAGRA